jgi:hypothetical protein
MKYLCLAYYEEKKWDALPKSEMDAIKAQCKTYDDMLKKTGRLVMHGSLAAPRATTVVRPGSGKTSVTDGPYLETKEQVGGFFLIEAKDLDEAIQSAMKHPAAHLGENVGWGIEMRPIDFYEQF